LLKWLKNFRKKDQKRLGECTLHADSPEQAITVALTWLTAGRISAYPKSGHYDIHVYEAKQPMLNGFYQIPLENFSPKDVLSMTLGEFVSKFRVGDALGVEEAE